MLTRRQVDMRNARDAGYDACLAKPVRQTVLYECLVNVMAGQPQETFAAPAISEPVNTAPAGLRGNILLVEDNLINQQVALGILQIQGYNVTVVNNGREALDACAQGAFDLILMDCHMPEMDGFEATREIRERERASSGKRVPIVALTANAMAQDREECLNAGMDDHLSKPFSMQTLQDMLDRWMPKAASAPAKPAEPSARAAGESRRDPRPQGARSAEQGADQRQARAARPRDQSLPGRVAEARAKAEAGDARQRLAGDRALRAFAQVEQRKRRREDAEPVLRGHRGVRASHRHRGSAQDHWRRSRPSTAGFRPRWRRKSRCSPQKV